MASKTVIDRWLRLMLIGGFIGVALMVPALIKSAVDSSREAEQLEKTREFYRERLKDL